MLRRKDIVSRCNATFMSLLPKKYVKSEINLALHLSLRNISYKISAYAAIHRNSVFSA